MFTFYGSCERDGQNQAGSKQIHNAEIFDDVKAYDPCLDITVADIDDNGYIGGDTDEDDQNDEHNLR